MITIKVFNKTQCFTMKLAASLIDARRSVAYTLIKDLYNCRVTLSIRIYGMLKATKTQYGNRAIIINYVYKLYLLIAKII